MHLTLKNRLVHARVYLSGGMVLAEFMPERERISPLFQPEWGKGVEKGGFLENLRGDFPCVPFGSAPVGATLPKGWAPDRTAADPDEFAHGFGAHHRWQVVKAGDAFLHLAINYPESHPVKQVERVVTLSAGEPKVFFEDIVHVRRDCRLPIGLHPIFRLPEESGMARLELPACRTLRTYPGRVDESSVFLPDAAAGSAKAVPLRTGGTADVTRLPLDCATEELLMLCGVQAGRAALVNQAENYRAFLEWDAELLPHLLLWLSNRGRRHAPWRGRNLCLGMEPIASAFDLGTAVSLGETPLGAKTSLSMRPGERVILRHALSVEVL